MKIALQQTEIAAEKGEVPVGAVLVTEDGQLFASHNAPISLHDASAHAEMRVIRDACEAVGNYRLTGSALYVTLEPCTMCAGAIVHARIARVV
ncbi:MAG TPA: nucleoside deaminase, partial [Mariprofundaceae bacterium]|nr:nucleoside deaminase [Mariprofundaceae bacterium]